MYKKQLRFQKIACLICIIAAAVSFLYSLGIMTDIYDSLYSTMRNPNDHTQTSVQGSIIYFDMQQFNKLFVDLSIVLILLACFLYIMNTHLRRKYYVGNYLAIGLYSVATVAVTVWSHLQINAFKAQYLTTVDFAALKEHAEMWGTLYTESTFWLDAHYFVALLAIGSVVALLANMILKIRLMRAEDALIHEGKEVAV